jgi:hypothetical protein
VEDLEAIFKGFEQGTRKMGVVLFVHSLNMALREERMPPRLVRCLEMAKDPSLSEGEESRE